MRNRCFCLLAAALSSACSNLGKMPDVDAVCDADPIQDVASLLEIEAVLKKPFPSPVENFINLAQSSLSARTLKHVTADRVVMLTEYRASFPSCGKGMNEPQILNSRQALGRMFLDQVGARDFRGILLSDACWKRRLKKLKLFESQITYPEYFIMSVVPESDPLFCDSVDPKLAFSTEDYAREAESLTRDVAESPDRGWLGLGLFTPSKEFLRYEYVSPFLAAVPEFVVDQLITALPKRSAELVLGTEVQIVYQTDKLFVKTVSGDRRVLIAAALLKAAFSSAVKAHAVPAFEEFRVQVAKLPKWVDEDVVRANAVDVVNAASAKVLRQYQESLAFVLAHELAHIYGQTSKEETADCLAVANLIEAYGAANIKPSDDVFAMIVDDVVTRHGELWFDGPVVDGNPISDRMSMIQQYVVQGRQRGVEGLRQLCAGP